MAPCAHLTSSAKISSSGLALIVAERASSRPFSDCSPSVFCASRATSTRAATEQAALSSATERQTWRLVPFGDGVADDEIGVMPLAAAREQGAAGLGIGALAGEVDLAVEPACRAPPAASVVDDEARAFADLGAGR